MSWAGILNLIALIVASTAVAYLWYYGGWRWYVALPLWPIIYLGIPILIGLIRDPEVGADMDGAQDEARRGDPPD